MSAAPNRPILSLRIISGAIYIGVSCKRVHDGGAFWRWTVPRLCSRVRAIVLLPFAMTLAAPKSTNLRHEAASRISVCQATVHMLSWLTVWFDITMFDRFGVQVIETGQYLSGVHLTISSSSMRPCSRRFARLPPSQYSSKMLLDHGDLTHQTAQLDVDSPRYQCTRRYWGATTCSLRQTRP